ncbi:hypothetical protein [Colwellia echini]|nr:hypothetical protein [Colwellia echini]
MSTTSKIKFLSSDIKKDNTSSRREPLEIDLNNEEESDGLKSF